jgi:hypothetical protein
MKKISYYFNNVLGALRVRSAVSGLEISDQVLRLVYFDGKAWQLQSARLEPGVLENGRIKDRAAFLAALGELRKKSKVAGRSKNRKVSVAVVLSSVNAYTQVFNLPQITGADLEKAVELNVQMASPGDATKINSGWQNVGIEEGSGQMDILSAFIDRDIVDEMAQALFEAKFLAVALEPRSVALARILREKQVGVDIKKSYILVDVGNAGMDFFIIRNGQPYFQYATPWSDIADDKGQIALEKFETQLTASLRQVLNFYAQHWPEPVSAVIISAVTFSDEIEKAVGEKFFLPALKMTLEMGQTISPEWLVPLGSSLWTPESKIGEASINLLGVGWRDRFYEEQFFGFLGFWQVLMPVMMAVLVVIFIAADAFLTTATATVEAEGPNGGSEQLSEITALEASSTQFNAMVSLVQNIESVPTPSATLLAIVNDAAASNQITVSHLSFSSGNVTVDGSAFSGSSAIAFKDALEQDQGVSAINLPVTAIQQNGNTVSFTMTFAYAMPAPASSSVQ